MKAFLDGDKVCIVGKDFINLQESPAIFATPEEFEKFIRDKSDTLDEGYHDGHKMGGCFVCKDGL